MTLVPPPGSVQGGARYRDLRRWAAAIEAKYGKPYGVRDPPTAHTVDLAACSGGSQVPFLNPDRFWCARLKGLTETFMPVAATVAFTHNSAPSAPPAVFKAAVGIYRMTDNGNGTRTLRLVTQGSGEALDSLGSGVLDYTCTVPLDRAAPLDKDARYVVASAFYRDGFTGTPGVVGRDLVIATHTYGSVGHGPVTFEGGFSPTLPGLSQGLVSFPSELSLPAANMKARSFVPWVEVSARVQLANYPSFSTGGNDGDDPSDIY